MMDYVSFVKSTNLKALSFGLVLTSLKQVLDDLAQGSAAAATSWQACIV